MTLGRIFDNVILYPNDEKYHQIKLASKVFSRKVWQYPACKELMKMSGWVVEGDHVRLKDRSYVQIASQLLHKSLLSNSSSATGVVPFPDDKFQVLIEALSSGDIPCIQNLLNVRHISPDGRIFSESGCPLHLLYTATIPQKIDTVKMLVRDYSMDPYVTSVVNNSPVSYIECMFWHAPQSFIIEVMKFCGVKAGFRSRDGFSLLHCTVYANCFDVAHFLLEECSDIDVNVTDLVFRTPLHIAYLCGHTQIAQYLIQRGADVCAMDMVGCTPYDHIDGDPDWIKDAEHLQNSRKIHHLPYSLEHCHFMKLINLGYDEEVAVSLTMERFPSLRDGITQPNIDYASALKEFTQFITSTKRSMDNNTSKQIPSGVQKTVGDHQQWRRPLSQVQRGHILF